MVEKVGMANFFHHFGEKTSSEIRGKSGEKLSWPIFSTTQAVLEAQIVENVGQDNFFHFFQEFLRKSLES